MSKNKPLLELKNVSMYFKKKKGFLAKPTQVGAVVDVSLEVNPGEILALVGESGCGKTTLGNLIIGLLKPTSGQISYKGKNIHKLSMKEHDEFRNAVQMVQQDSYAALNPMRTILQSLSAPLIQKKIVKNNKEAYARASELLKTVELNPPEMFLEKFPHQLSGGQRQRVLMARALSMSPKIIVADEPVSMIDVSLRISMLNLMAHLNKTLDIAFIYITHDLATAKYIAQHGRIAVMYLGKMVESGSVEEVLNNPKHPYLQALLSAVPIPSPRIAKQKRPLPLKSLEMPKPANPPKGCRFNPRCPYAIELCETQEPQPQFNDGRLIACHKAEEIPRWSLDDLKEEMRA